MFQDARLERRLCFQRNYGGDILLDENLIKEFVKVTHDPEVKKQEGFVYGVVSSVEAGDTIVANVTFDGASSPTPCSTSVNVAEGDRVLVMIKNRKATVTANLSSPSINVDYLVAGDAVISGTLIAANGEFLGTVTVDWSQEHSPMMASEVLIGSDDNAPIAVRSTYEGEDEETTVFPGTVIVQDDEGRNWTQMSAEDGFSTSKREKSQIGLGIYSGVTESFTVGASGYTDKEIQFPQAFSVSPVVVATVTAGSTAAALGNIMVAVESRTTTGAKFRVYNNNSSSRFIGIHWIAIGH